MPKRVMSAGKDAGEGTRDERRSYRRIGNHVEDFDSIARGETVVTYFGVVITRLMCGHFRNEDAYNASSDGGERSDDFCWQGCHARRTSDTGTDGDEPDQRDD